MVDGDLAASSSDLANRCLLIYLPCHDDFALALEQVTRIRSYVNALPFEVKSLLNVRVCVSVNSSKIESRDILELQTVADHVISYGFPISGDLNITLGFLRAVEFGCDFLWILSANDVVAETALTSIYNNLVSRPEIDLIVTGNVDDSEIHAMSSIFVSPHTSFGYGLISSVIYRMDKFRDGFSWAVQLSWSGWGQLAYIERACIKHGIIRPCVIRGTALHIQDRGVGISRRESRMINKKKYAHSYFGGPVLINSLYGHEPSKRKKLLNKWVRENWFMRNFYSSVKDSTGSGEISQDIWDPDFINVALRRCDLWYRALYKIGRLIPMASADRILELVERRIKRD